MGDNDVMDFLTLRQKVLVAGVCVLSRKRLSFFSCADFLVKG